MKRSVTCQSGGGPQPEGRRPSTFGRNLSVSMPSQGAGGASDGASIRTIATASSQTLQDGKPMFFLEMNPYAPETVVLLHVLFSSHLEWKDVWHKLPGHHLLIPDLPCHSQSKGVCRREDYSLQVCTEHVADMIRTHAHDGAHVVGLSYGGGWTAMELARKYPELVRSVYVSGAWPLNGFRASVANSPRLIYTGLWTLLHAPAGKRRFFAASGLSGEYYNDELFAEIKANVSSKLAKTGLAKTLGYDWLGEVGQAGRRMLIIAGGNTDNPQDAVKAGQVVNAQDKGRASVYVVEGAAHCWNLQLPALFAKSIQCWVENRPLPPEFKALHA